MILYRMTLLALERAKATIEDVSWHYFVKTQPDWMEEIWGPDVFEPFSEVPDFQLAPVSNYKQNERGQLDIENCIRIYQGLQHLTPSQASHESLWAGICNKNFYTYMRERWGYDRGGNKTEKELALEEIEEEMNNSEEKEEQRISGKARNSPEARFFFGEKGHGIFRNTLAKCWWISYLLYDAENLKDPYWRLRVLGPENFSTNVSDIFVNYGFSKNPNVLDGIIEGIRRCREEKLPTIKRGKPALREGLKYLNAVGGSVLLDTLSRDEIADILVAGVREPMLEL